MPGHKIMTQKFTKNISYMIYPFPFHIAMCIAINTTAVIRLKGNNFLL